MRAFAVEMLGEIADNGLKSGLILTFESIRKDYCIDVPYEGSIAQKLEGKG